MKLFSCDNCEQPLFFENVMCLRCGHALAVLPEAGLPLAAMVQAPNAAPPPLATAATTDTTPAQVEPPPLWQRIPQRASPRRYRMCQNHVLYQACNFAVVEEDPNALCVSCRQTQLLPDLSQPGNPQRWLRIETAKRRLFYTLVQLGLIHPDRIPESGDMAEDAPRYAFLADQPGQAPVLTGHVGGNITLNVAEADDDERERRRLALGEPYRTLLGHLRHESGHFYWDRLIRDGNRIDAFRQVFGDESQDYAQALQTHYANHISATATTAWQAGFVSAYAQAHPWEDWAETWAHYLHMVDLLETAAAYQTSVVIPDAGPDVAHTPDNPFEGEPSDFDTMIRQWIPVTLLVNSLNRSLGQDDAYPFALSQAALHKLRFVHDVIVQCQTGAANTNTNNNIN